MQTLISRKNIIMPTPTTYNFLYSFRPPKYLTKEVRIIINFPQMENFRQRKLAAINYILVSQRGHVESNTVESILN